MRAARLLLALAPLLAPSLAQAGPWAKVGGDKDSIVLLDQSSVRKADGGRKAWTLQSFRQPQTTPDGKPYLSVKSQHLYACDEASRTPLAQFYFPEVLGKGEPVGSYKYEAYDAEQIAPGSPNESTLKAVCRPKRKIR
jgi:hypothetical protein